MTQQLEHQELKRRALASAGWTLTRIGSDQGFAFVIFVLLARILNPHDMGVFALALAAAEMGKLIASAGFPDAVIRQPELDRELLDTIFWVNLALSVLLFLVLCAAARPVATFFREPVLVQMVTTLSALLPLSALGSIHTARTLRDFGHRAVATRSLVSNCLGGGIAIVAATRGLGAWSMVLQRLVVEVVVVLLAWHAYPWLPTLNIALKRVGKTWRFSFHLMVSQVLVMVMMRFQDVTIGRVLSVEAVGIYRLGWRFIDLLIQLCVAPFATIALPTLSRLQRDALAFKAAVMRFNSVVAIIVCPAMLCFGAVAPQLVPLVFGRQWSGAGAVAQVLSLLALPYATSSLTGPIFSARGAADRSAKLAWIQLMVAVPVILLAAPFGPLAVAIGYVVRGYLVWPLQIYLMLKETSISLRSLWMQSYLPVLSSLVAAGLIVAFGPSLAALLSGWSYVVAALLLQVLVYVGLMLICGREYVQSQWHSLRSLRRV